MDREVRVLLAEDDYYARSWMELLLRRDWRTKVVAQVSSPAELGIALHDMHRHRESADLVLMDTEIPGDERWLAESIQRLEREQPSTLLLFTAVAPPRQYSELWARPNFGGYLLKQEICYSLAWAVALAAEGHRVLTPSIHDFFAAMGRVPPGTLVLDGRKGIYGFSPLEERRSRMVFMFSMARHEFADEEGISEDFSYGVVSALYEKLGLNDILNGEVEAGAYFGVHPTVSRHLRLIRDSLGPSGSRKAQDKETLAFHMLTLPQVHNVSL